ncbi:MAG: ComEC/Rec2 family competence protein [Candidatus Hermodarchaeia archaeon]|jgi:competence protein ComEC
MLTKWKYILAILALGASVVWLAVVSFPEERLRLIACDVGQGDAILAVYGEVQILVDGGPGNDVVECMSQYVPFWDREIEVVILTHPQKDHFGGLVEVFRQYDVETLLATSLDVSSSDYEVLKRLVGGSDTRVVNPTSGISIRVGLLQLDILWPTEEFVQSHSSISQGISSKNVLGAFTSTRDPNDFSIVTLLEFGDFEALMTGDINSKTMDSVIQADLIGDVDYIKIPHHGSKNGLSADLLRFSEPEIAVISVGKNNPYDHPHEEILKLLSDHGVRIMRTDRDGDVEIVSDGKRMWLGE